MYLTRQADYTMRLLIHLAIQPDKSATIQEIAEHYRISRNHLMKVANRAVQAGYVEAARGRGGGLKLARRPKEISIGTVLREVEDWRIVECFELASNRCPIAGGCGLRPILKEALDAYLAVLDRYSLADVVNRKNVLIQLLGLKIA
ncbi:MAG TPA: Rrf2 family transcriptional regulator [Bryobacteraceae bacterium]|nr:Rrf2 family transcriptional regulator [Bryobacteraceae bacterium]